MCFVKSSRRSEGRVLAAGVACLGMIFFPRLTASLAGAMAGPPGPVHADESVQPPAKPTRLSVNTSAGERASEIRTALDRW